jgi:hypothetical protein
VQLLGDWKNVNPNTRSIVRILITDVGGTIEIHPWGACSPTPCDLGTVKATAYSPDVGAPLPTNAQYLQAEFKTSFSVRTIIIGPAPAPGGNLFAVVLTQFADNGDRRSAYASADTFKK